MPTFILNKLVRDKLRSEYERMNQTATYRQLSKTEFGAELVRKIIEEVKEIPVGGTKEAITAELADAQQAIDDLMALHSILPSEVREVKQKKLIAKGGFAGAAFVTTLELSDDDTWVDYYRSAPDIFSEVCPNDEVPAIPFIEAGVYRHYKGKRYEVVGVGLDSETTKPVVVYVPLYESSTPFWVRSYEMFLEFVEVDGVNVRRFEKVDA